MNIFITLILLLSGPMFIHGKTIQVQGHRGTRGTLPENTLPAFQSAIEAGADFLELDLLMTRDGHLVIYHDFFIHPERVCYLDGTTVSSPSPLIYSLDLAQVKQFDCGRIANPLFPRQKPIPGTQIPTLEELFEMIHSLSDPHGKTISLNLEIKRDSRYPEYTPDSSVIVQTLFALVKKQGFSDRVYYSSFDPESLIEVRAQDPHAKIAFLKEDDLVGMTNGAAFVKAESVSPEHILIRDKDHLQSLQKLGFKVILWTVNDPQRWEELIDMGVDGIITDYPADLIVFLQDRAKKFTTSTP